MVNLKYLPILDTGAVSPIFFSFREGDDNEYIHLLLKTIELIYQKIEIEGEIMLNIDGKKFINSGKLRH